MAKFLTRSGTVHHIEDIIKNAKTKVLIVSPFLKLSLNSFQRLKDADRRNIKIVIVFGKKELSQSEENSLAQLKNLELWYCDELHAKCYKNEDEAIITSMNLLEYSENNNREMGVLFNAKDDQIMFRDVSSEIDSIINASEKQFLKITKRNIDRKSESKNLKGYCLRCGNRIVFNSSKPYCLECYGVWSLYSNKDYDENYCHSCGEFEMTSMNKPLCYDCYKS